MESIFVNLVILSVFILNTKTQQIEQPIHITPLIGDQKYLINGTYKDFFTSIDQVWYSYQEIELRIISFGIDIQSGDFILVSQYILDLEVDSANNPILPVHEYMLLSESQPFFNTTIQLVNPSGVSIYFHGLRQFDRASSQTGFVIEVGLIDKKEPEPSTTTENIISTPNPETSYYSIKFIVGKTPAKFVDDLQIFKQNLAEMTNLYCEQKGIQLQIDATEQDVSVPLAYLRYCDRSWPPYDNCIEARFAISVYNQAGDYVMDSTKIDEMWAAYSNSFGYDDYEPPGNDELSGARIWVTGFLGFILVILPLLCIVWLKKWSDEYKKDSGVLEIQSADSNDGSVVSTFYDRNNPVFAPIKREPGGFDNKGFDNRPVYRENSLFEENFREDKSEFSTDDEEEHVQHYPVFPERMQFDNNNPGLGLEQSNSHMY